MDASEARKQLLAQRLQGRKTDSAPSLTISKSPDKSSHPISPSQGRIWLLQQQNPNSPIFNVVNSHWYEGPLDASRLTQAVRTLLQRHQILCCQLQEHGENAQLHPVSPEQFQVESVHLTKAEILQRAQQEANRAFDLASEIPIRLFQFQASDHPRSLLQLVTHDLVFDKWSLGLFWKELSCAYQEQPSLLPPLPIQYFDFANWQHGFIKTESYQQQLQSWVTRLEECPPILELPSDLPPPITRSDAGRLTTRQVSPEVTNQLRQLASSCDTSLYTLILTAFKVFLLRMCRESDIVVGTPIANRRLPELSNLIGFFLNTSALRTDLSDNPTFLDALARVRETVSHALDNQDVVFDDLVREVDPPRQPGQHPFFSTMFIFQREQEAVPPIDIPRCRFEMTYLMPEVAKNDLSLFAAERDGGLETIFEYRTDLFTPALMEKLLENFSTLLQSIASAPTAVIQELNLISATDLSYPQALPSAPEPAFILDRIAKQVQEQPKSLALDGERALTYQEVWDQSAALAQNIAAQQIQAEPIALLIPRSNEAILAILAILRSGNSYLPLDPALPDQRLHQILNSGTAKAVFTNSENRVRLSCELPIFESSNQSQEAHSPIDLPVNHEALAYLILTSGSTGQPKPVAITHANLAHSTSSRKTYYKSPPKRFLLISSLSFDSSIAGLFWTLAEGGTLVPMPVGLEQDIHALAGFIREQDITHLLTLPSLYQLLLDHSSAKDLASLHVVIIAGESCSSQLAASHLKKLPSCQLHNEYGPTETSVWASVQPITAAEQPVPIGQAIPGVHLTLLDSQQQAAPRGMIGEIAISGPTLAQGYYQHPELTAERFLEANAKRPRTYLTGDLARQSLDGTFYFLGRKDRQLKVRGYRIEPTEIEAALCQLNQVKEASVIADKQLHAFLVATEPPAREVLTTHLRSCLPDYMVPSTFQFLTQLPTLINGKVDTATLANLTKTTPNTEKITPHSEIEKTLADIWGKVLNITSPSIHDNFFELGGDSITSIRFLAQARNQGLNFEANDLFQHPTIATLATVVRDENKNVPSLPFSSLVEVKKGNSAPLYLVHTIRGGVTSVYKLAQHFPAEQTVFGLQAPPEPFSDMVSMATAYLKEILEHQPEGPYYLGGFCTGGVVALEMARQLQAQNKTVKFLALLDSAPPEFADYAESHLRSKLSSILFRLKNRPPKIILRALARRIRGQFSTSNKDKASKIEPDPEFEQWLSSQNIPPHLILNPLHPYRKATALHYCALRDYCCTPYSEDIWLFRTNDSRFDEYLGWDKHITGKIHLQKLSFNHSDLFREAGSSHLARGVMSALEEIRPSKH